MAKFKFIIAALILLPLQLRAYTEIPSDVWSNIDSNGEVQIVITLKGYSPPALAAKTVLMNTAQDVLLGELLPHGFRLGYKLSHLPIISGTANNDVLTALYNREDILAVEFDRPLKMSLAESVPLVEGDYVQNTLGYDGSGVVVAILDTGIDTDHANFAGGRIKATYHFLGGGADVGLGAEDAHGHGTNVAGIVASSGALGDKGMAPACDLVAIQVLSSTGAGQLSDFTSGLNWILANDTLNIRVANASLGSNSKFSTECSAVWVAMATAVAALKAAGVMVVAASGNDGQLAKMSAPACIGDVVSVGASFDSNLGREPNSGTWLDNFGAGWPPCFDDPANARGITCFSNRNALLDLLAPGRPITSSYNNGGLITFTGTSMASPHVAGLAALMLHAEAAATPDELLSIMQTTGISVFDGLTGLTFQHIASREAVEAVLDLDGDGITKALDNCPTVFNPLQEDTDGDDIGDACCCISTRGNASNDLEDKANVSDVSYLVAWLFGIPSGPDPGCPPEANANGDNEEKVNVSDVSYLVSWLFGIPSGPAPGVCP